MVRRINWNALRKPILLFCAGIFTTLLFSADLRAETQSSSSMSEGLPEYLVKAVMLYHFAKFTKWPEASFEDSDTPIRFCVLGDDPFGADLDSLVNYQIRGRDILTTRLNKARHAKSCHLLFISDSESERLPSILRALADRPVLTIADMVDFTGRGGIVYLKLANSNIRFEINTGYAQLVGLSFRSALLMLADTISGEINRGRFRAPTN